MAIRGRPAPGVGDGGSIAAVLPAGWWRAVRRPAAPAVEGLWREGAVFAGVQVSLPSRRRLPGGRGGTVQGPPQLTPCDASRSGTAA